VFVNIVCVCVCVSVSVVELTVLRCKKRDPWAAGFSMAVGHQKSEMILCKGFQFLDHVTKDSGLIVQ